MESKQESESDKNSLNPLKAKDLPSPGKNSESTSCSSSFSSSSSSSSSSFEEDGRRRDESELSTPINDASRVPELQNEIPASPHAITVEYSLSEISTNESPPIQVTGREEESTPYQIPSRVFEQSPSATPVEWSVTSNESLFSIHTENNSFSADQVILMGRSGELGMPGDYNKFLDSKFGESSNTQSPTSAGLGNGNLGVEEAAAETMKDVIRATSEDRDKGEIVHTEGVYLSPSVSPRSDESANSVVSFAFPILTGEASRAISAKVEPEHPVQLPQEPPKESSVDQPKEQLQVQPSSPTPPSAAPPAAQKKWFPCFSCCSFCR